MEWRGRGGAQHRYFHATLLERERARTRAISGARRYVALRDELFFRLAYFMDPRRGAFPEATTERAPRILYIYIYIYIK